MATVEGPSVTQIRGPGELMASLRKVYCTFPKDLIREPVLHYLSKRFDVISNIRGASITDQVGLVYLEIEGAEDEITRAVQYLKDRGVKVDDVKDSS